jgi:hypothetical protein
VFIRKLPTISFTWMSHPYVKYIFKSSSLSSSSFSYPGSIHDTNVLGSSTHNLYLLPTKYGFFILIFFMFILFYSHWPSCRPYFITSANLRRFLTAVFLPLLTSSDQWDSKQLPCNLDFCSSGFCTHSLNSLFIQVQVVLISIYDIFQI